MTAAPSPGPAVSVFRLARSRAAEALTALANTLKGCGGMAGSDEAAKRWTARYDPACGGRKGAVGAMEAASDVVNVLGQIHDLLLTFETWFGQVELGASDSDLMAVVPGVVDVYSVPAVPLALGDGPADVGRLRLAAQAWSAAADGFRSIAALIPEAVEHVRDDPSLEAPATIVAFRHAQGRLVAVADGLDALSRSCEEYADSRSSLWRKTAKAEAAAGIAETVGTRFDAITANLERLLQFRFALYTLGDVVDRLPPFGEVSVDDPEDPRWQEPDR